MTTEVRTTARAGTLVAAVLCGCLCVWSLALVFADLAMSRPRAALQAWESGDRIGDVALRRRLLARIGRAVAVHPADADQRMDLGRFFAWHAARHPQGSERHAFYARLAAARFEEAVAARPTWGFAWIMLAEQLARLGAGDELVLAAMRRGGALAPLEPDTQLKHLWLGLARWSRLTPEHRAMLTGALGTLLASPDYFAEAARIVLLHGRDELLAGATGQPWQQRALSALQGDAPS